MLTLAKYTTTCLLIVVGIVHLIPVTGVLGASRISLLYGVAIADENLAILMRHRAVLFGLIGALLLYAAFNPSLQPLALVAGLVSVVSFLWLAIAAENYNAAVARVFAADLLALACLLLASAAFAYVQVAGDSKH